MSTGTLEHVNITVSDPQRTAHMLCTLFGWHVRWEGAAIAGGHTIHVGNGQDYLALYRPVDDVTGAPDESYTLRGGLNHVGIVVEDIDATEEKVRAAGFTPHNHADYEPGRRFYFRDSDNIEFEVVSYA